MISVAESMSKKSQRNGIGVSLKSHRESYSDERVLPEHLERRARQAVLGEHSVQRKFYSTAYDMEIPNFGTKKIQNTHYSSRNESLNLKNHRYWKILLDRSSSA